MRRRRQLEVSTFPFLAVLLCTMGSLILLLLVLDRRAKIVALNKAKNDFELVKADADHRSELTKAENSRRQQERLQRQAEAERLAKEHRAEWEERSRQLHAALAAQEEELLGHIEEVRSQVAAADAKLHAEESDAEKQKKLVELARISLFGLKQKSQADKEAVAKAEQLSESARRELDRQTQELAQLQQTLVNLKS